VETEAAFYIIIDAASSNTYPVSHHLYRRILPRSRRLSLLESRGLRLKNTFQWARSVGAITADGEEGRLDLGGRDSVESSVTCACVVVS
jgi:hypothetical protein